MKQKILLLILLGIIYSAAKANETEPNNTRAQANTLALNSTNSGKINPAGEQDWWKVTTNGDGKLDVTLTPLSGRYTYVYLYDNDGVTQLAGNYSNGAFTISADGLAVGTYYMKVICYYSTDTSSYIISNQLTKPTQANDTEPDSTKALALTLPLDGSVTGHVGYEYNNHRDTTDWYKLTTNADGLIRLTLTPANGQYTFVTLYDHDGTTVLNSNYSNSVFSISTDGLAAGTYYARVYCYYTNGFAPYALADSLFIPALANDAEPDSTKALALTLPLDGLVTGHVGYEYNNHRDTTDWYKLTTNKDGLIRLTLTPANGQYTFVTLYDHDGTTVLKSDYSNGVFSISTDGLTAGTYYARVYCYYSNGFAPYTLADSLFTYTNANDVESNNQPYLAKTLPANTVTPGHVGFYYNNQRDTSDWWKINYTGSGALSVALNMEPTKLYGYQYTYLQIWKDTLANPIYSDYSQTSLTANLTSLTQGYYYVRVIEYYNSQFESYTLTPTFTQVNKAKIIVTSYDTAGSCTNNKISYKLSKSHAPYTVQLSRFGVKYSSAVAQTSTITFDSLPDGRYNATVFGDGATGNAFGKSDTITIMPASPATSTTTIKSTQAKLNWTIVVCADYDSIQYRVHGTTSWSHVNTGNTGAFILKGLIPSTTYDWQVAAIDSSNKIEAISAFTPVTTFTTTATGFDIASTSDESDLSAGNSKLNNPLMISPNPASSYFTIHYSTTTKDKLIATLYDENAKPVWTSGSLNADALNGKQVMVNQFGSGLYYLKIINSQGGEMQTTKVSIMR